MVKLISILMLVTLAGHAQKKDQPVKKIQQDSVSKIVLDELQRMTVIDREKMVQQDIQTEKQFQIYRESHQQEYDAFINRILVINKIPLDRISIQGDSLQITSTEIILKLRKSKTTQK